MDYRVDQKGKFYTARVTKEANPVVVTTPSHLIRGTLHVMRETRLKDELNNAERFVAITDADIFDLSGENHLYSNKVLLVNKDLIVWVMPQEDPQAPEEDDRSE